jgi:hypothetical protein
MAEAFFTGSCWSRMERSAHERQRKEGRRVEPCALDETLALVTGGKGFRSWADLTGLPQSEAKEAGPVRPAY